MSWASTSGRRLFQSSSSRSISARSAMPPNGSIRTTQSVALWARAPSAARLCATSSAWPGWRKNEHRPQWRYGNRPRKHVDLDVSLGRDRETRRVRRKTARPASSESGLPATYCRLFVARAARKRSCRRRSPGRAASRTWGDPDAAAGSPRTSPGRARRLEGGSILDSEPESGLRCVPADIGHPYRE